MTTDAICNEVRRERVRLQGKQLILEANNLLDVDPAAAVAMLQENAAILRNECTPRKVDVHIADGFNRVWNKYCATERGELSAVYPWPWAPLQEVTMGVQDTDYIILYGRPKSMKSWVLCFIIGYILTLNLSYRVLIYSKEMDADEIFERIGCVIAGVVYGNFTQGKLTPEERRNIMIILDMLQALRDSMTVVCLSAQDVKQGQDTVAWLESKIERYKPQAVFVDGMYLMSDGAGAKKTHERVANISREMRQLILRKRVPVIATVQANREAAKNEEANIEEVAFSDSLGQDATMLIRVINEWKKANNTLALVMGGATRRYKLNGFRIYGEPAINFSYYGELSEADAQDVLKKEAAAKEAKGKKARPITGPDNSGSVNKVASDIAATINA
jgi:replicative DNA helicase